MQQQFQLNSAAAGQLSSSSSSLVVQQQVSGAAAAECLLWIVPGESTHGEKIHQPHHPYVSLRTFHRLALQQSRAVAPNDAVSTQASL